MSEVVSKARIFMAILSLISLFAQTIPIKFYSVANGVYPAPAQCLFAATLV